MACNKVHKKQSCENAECTTNGHALGLPEAASSVRREHSEGALTNAQRNRLRENTAVVSRLRDETLQAVISAIDSADEPQAALQSRLACDPHFASFADEVLRTLREPRDGDEDDNEAAALRREQQRIEAARADIRRLLTSHSQDGH